MNFITQPEGPLYLRELTELPNRSPVCKKKTYLAYAPSPRALIGLPRMPLLHHHQTFFLIFFPCYAARPSEWSVRMDDVITGHTDSFVPASTDVLVRWVSFAHLGV